MNITLFFTVFIGLGIIYTIIGLCASRNINTNADYFLAGRNLGLWPLVFTLLATQIGGGMLLGTAEEAYKVGLYGFTYTLGMCVGFLLLGFGFAQKLQSLKVATTAELFETRYNSLFLKKVASLLSVATMSGILIGQIIGSKKLLLSLGFNNEILFIAFWLFTIWYTMAGGLRAVIWTDTIQIIFILSLFVGLFAYNIFTVPSSMSVFWDFNEPFFDQISFNTNTLIGTLLMPILFSLIEQDLAQRFFAAKTPQVAKKAAFLSAIGLFIFSCIPIYFGIQAKLTGITISSNMSPLIPYLTTFTHEIILVFAACAIIAAITSTADSLLCAIGSNLAQDFDFSWIKMSSIQRSRLITMVIGLVTLAASYVISPNIIGILIASYELSVACLLVPLLFCYFKKEVYTQAAVWSIIAGLIGFCVFRYISLGIAKEVATLLLSFIAYNIGHYLAKKRYTKG